jgi:hypothetical protein
MDSDVMSVANTVSMMRRDQMMTAVQTKLLRDSMDAPTQAIQDLLQAMPAVPVVNPAHLGQNIDVKV